MRESSCRSSGEYRPHDDWYDGNEYRIHHAGRKHFREVGAGVRKWEVKVEKISAITLRVASMRTSVQFYRDVLGMKIIYGGEDGYFSSLSTKGANDPIVNLEEGRSETQWGRLIFYYNHEINKNAARITRYASI